MKKVIGLIAVVLLAVVLYNVLVTEKKPKRKHVTIKAVKKPAPVVVKVKPEVIPEKVAAKSVIVKKAPVVTKVPVVPKGPSKVEIAKRKRLEAIKKHNKIYQDKANICEKKLIAAKAEKIKLQAKIKSLEKILDLTNKRVIKSRKYKNVHKKQTYAIESYKRALVKQKEDKKNLQLAKNKLFNISGEIINQAGLKASYLRKLKR